MSHLQLRRTAPRNIPPDACMRNRSGRNACVAIACTQSTIGLNSLRPGIAGSTRWLMRHGGGRLCVAHGRSKSHFWQLQQLQQARTLWHHNSVGVPMFSKHISQVGAVGAREAEARLPAPMAPRKHTIACVDSTAVRKGALTYAGNVTPPLCSACACSTTWKHTRQPRESSHARSRQHCGFVRHFLTHIIVPSDDHHLQHSDADRSAATVVAALPLFGPVKHSMQLLHACRCTSCTRQTLACVLGESAHQHFCKLRDGTLRVNKSCGGLAETNNKL